MSWPSSGAPSVRTTRPSIRSAGGFAGEQQEIARAPLRDEPEPAFELASRDGAAVGACGLELGHKAVEIVDGVGHTTTYSVPAGAWPLFLSRKRLPARLV